MQPAAPSCTAATSWLRMHLGARPRRRALAVQEQLHLGGTEYGLPAGGEARGGGGVRRSASAGAATQPVRRTVGMEDLLGRRLGGAEAKYAPRVVYTAGPMEIPLSGPRVSVIGSRNAPDSGLAAARAVSRALCKAGAVVVSGLAAGVDAAAHREAIDSGGRTIAVIGTPLERSYPAANAGLQAEIMRSHLAVSQFAPGSPVSRSNFVRRNATMALLSDATVVASATCSSSGTRHHARDALGLGRPLFLYRSVASGPAASWAGEMLGRGAVLVDGPEDIVDGIMRGRLA